MFNEDVRLEIERVATARGWDAAALMAVAEVESNGQPFALVDGRQEPLIRFEGHYFDRRLSGAKQAQARKAGLASPKAGAVKNPASQEARWRMLRRAAEIDIKAAYESTSWGVGQVMGAHWKTLGYRSVDDLVLDARSGVYGQVRLMANYISSFGLAGALNRHDWKAFSRGYNGPNFAAGGYDKKMAAAYKRYAALPPLPPAPKTTQKPVDAPAEPEAPEHQPNPQPHPAPTPESSKPHVEKLGTSKRFWTWLTAFFGAIGTMADKIGWADLDYRVQIAILAVIAAVALYGIGSMPRTRQLVGRLFGGAS